jgi:hypothetical protein
MLPGVANAAMSANPPSNLAAPTKGEDERPLQEVNGPMVVTMAGSAAMTLAWLTCPILSLWIHGLKDIAPQ